MLQIGGDEGDTTNEWDVDSGLDPGIEEGDKGGNEWNWSIFFLSYKQSYSKQEKMIFLSFFFLVCSEIAWKKGAGNTKTNSITQYE